MPMQALLLTRDDEVIRVLQRVLQDMEVQIELCTALEKAKDELARRKFDAVIIDCDDVHGAADLLSGLRKLASNKTSTAFAIINGVTSVHNAFAMGANLALEKPISLDRAKHSFRAAHGLMQLERRRYYRHPVDMAVTLSHDEREKKPKRDLFATASNISEGGMAVKLKSALPNDSRMYVLKFILPGTKRWIETRGMVAWADSQGQAGIRFERPPLAIREQMERWFLEKQEGRRPTQGHSPKRTKFS